MTSDTNRREARQKEDWLAFHTMGSASAEGTKHRLQSLSTAELADSQTYRLFMVVSVLTM